MVGLTLFGAVSLIVVRGAVRILRVCALLVLQFKAIKNYAAEIEPR